MIEAIFQTLFMIFLSGTIAFSIGIPFGFFLFFLYEKKAIYRPVSFIVNATRSFPFAILIITLIPFTRFVVGTSLGTKATIVPLSVAAIPFVARMIESALLRIDPGLIEAMSLMGMNQKNLAFRVLLPEIVPAIIQTVTLTLIHLVGYSAMAGMIGGGGLGQIAMQYGYQRFNVSIMCETVLYLIILVECIEQCGRLSTNFILKKRGKSLYA